MANNTIGINRISDERFLRDFQVMIESDQSILEAFVNTFKGSGDYSFNNQEEISSFLEKFQITAKDLSAIAGVIKFLTNKTLSEKARPEDVAAEIIEFARQNKASIWEGQKEFFTNALSVDVETLRKYDARKHLNSGLDRLESVTSSFDLRTIVNEDNVICGFTPLALLNLEIDNTLLDDVRTLNLQITKKGVLNLIETLEECKSKLEELEGIVNGKLELYTLD